MSPSSTIHVHRNAVESSEINLLSLYERFRIFKGNSFATHDVKWDGFGEGRHEIMILQSNKTNLDVVMAL